MAQLIPLSRLARLVGKPRSLLQQMAQRGELQTFDGQVDLEQALTYFPDVKLDNDAELRRVEEIKAQAIAKGPSARELPDINVMHERLRTLGRDYAAARGKLLHYERVIGWIDGRLANGIEAGTVSAEFANDLSQWIKSELAAPASDLKRWEEFLAQERIMRVMTAQITVLPKGQTFEVLGDESILEAGLRAGMPMPYGCSNGTCGDCKCRVMSGEVLKVRPHDYVLSAIEKQQGYVLACCYTAVGDAAIDVPLVGAKDIPEQTLRAKVRDVEPLGGNRIALHLMTSRAERMRYFAGQWLEITVEGETRRVPTASCPCDERRIEVHIECDSLDSRDAANPYRSLTKNAEVEIRGPYGSFVLDDASERPIILIAEGAGFAQIKSILQHALSLEHAPTITLIRLANDDGLYQENLLKSYAGALDNFHYMPFESSATAETAIDAVLAEASDPTNFDIYAAGSGGFIEAVRARIIAAGLPTSQWKDEVVA